MRRADLCQVSVRSASKRHRLETSHDRIVCHRRAVKGDPCRCHEGRSPRQSGSLLCSKSLCAQRSFASSLNAPPSPPSAVPTRSSWPSPRAGYGALQHWKCAISKRTAVARAIRWPPASPLLMISAGPRQRGCHSPPAGGASGFVQQEPALLPLWYFTSAR